MANTQGSSTENTRSSSSSESRKTSKNGQTQANTGHPADATAATDTSPQEHAIASIFDPFIKQSEMNWWSGRNANALSQMASASMEGAMKVNGEVTRFMSERLKEDMDTAAKFTKCRTGEDVFRTGSCFFDGMIRSYADQTARMVHMLADVTQGACRPIEDRTIEALHSVALIPKDNGQFA